MGLRTYTRSVDVLEISEDLEVELPIRDPCGVAEDPLVGYKADGTIVVSYIVYDEGRTDLDPSKQDCSGWQEFIVLGSQRDADELSNQFDCPNCGHPWRDHVDDDGNMRTDLESWLGCEGYEKSPAQQALDDGRAFLFEHYEHGNIIYALRGESSQVDRQWDVTAVSGFMWADDEWGPDVDIEQAARDFLEEYTNWANGWVYTIVHAEYTPTGELLDWDCCGGYIGWDYAERECKDEHEGMLS